MYEKITVTTSTLLSARFWLHVESQYSKAMDQGAAAIREDKDSAYRAEGRSSLTTHAAGRVFYWTPYVNNLAGHLRGASGIAYKILNKTDY